MVVDAPPPGQAVTAQVDDLRLVRTDEAGTAIAYQASLSLRTDMTEYRTTYVVLIRQPDGRWLVKQETASLQPGD